MPDNQRHARPSARCSFPPLLQNAPLEGLSTTSFATTPGMSVQLNYYLTIQCAARLLPDGLAALQNGELEPQARSENEGAYYRRPDSASFDRLRTHGHPLVSHRQLLGILSGRYDGHRADFASLSDR